MYKGKFKNRTIRLWTRFYHSISLNDNYWFFANEIHALPPPHRPYKVKKTRSTIKYYFLQHLLNKRFTDHTQLGFFGFDRKYNILKLVRVPKKWIQCGFFIRADIGNSKTKNLTGNFQWRTFPSFSYVLNITFLKLPS